MKKSFSLAMVVLSILSIPSPCSAQIPNFHEVEEGFFRGGQPDEEGIRALKALGFETVISFRNEKKLIQWEREKVEQSGMTFVSIPLTWTRSPTREEAERFLANVSKENRPVFVHCREGRDRTGAMVALYRIAHQGCPAEVAYHEAKRYGFRDMAFPLRRFILVKAKFYAYGESSPKPSPFETVWILLFYLFEGLTVLLGFSAGILCFQKPEWAMKVQERFYERINWRIAPVSLQKEIRNTKIMGGLLLTISFLLVLTLVMLY